MRTVNVVEDFIPHQDLEEIVNRHSVVFSEGLGTCIGPAVKIHVESGAMPKFCAARPIPYAWRDEVDQVLEKNGRRGHYRASETF